MKLSHFNEILAIAERGSIRAAARHLNMAQPALTRNLADVERELGAPLFERRTRGVVATAIGEAFVRRASSILQDVRRTREEIEQLRGDTTGTITIGLSIAAHLTLLPAVLQPFRARYPDIRLHVIEGFYPTLEAGFRNGVVDFYIGPDPGPKLMPGMSKETLWANLRIVLCRNGHPLARATSLRQLSDAHWVTTSITEQAEDEFEALFSRHRLPAPKLMARSQSALTLMTCLMHSDLLAMVPQQWNDFALTKESLTPIAIKERLPAPSIVLIKREDLPLTPAAAFFLELMRRARPQPSQ